MAEDGSVTFKQPKNVKLFSFRPPVWPAKEARLRIAGCDVVPLPAGWTLKLDKPSIAWPACWII